MSDSNWDYDVIVVGAGPAGSACARFLALGSPPGSNQYVEHSPAGGKPAHVLLIDSAVFPRDKVCGDAVGGKSLSILKDLGVKEAIDESVPHIQAHNIVFSSPKGTVLTVPLPPEEVAVNEAGYVITRLDFDEHLFRMAQEAGAETLEATTVKEVLFEGDQVVGVKISNSDSEREIRAPVVIGADGVHSVVAKQTGCYERDDLHFISSIRGYWKDVKHVSGKGLVDHDIEIHFIKRVIPGYFWIFPLPDGRANVGLGIVIKHFHKKKKKNPSYSLRGLLEDVISKEPAFANRFEGSEKEGRVVGALIPCGSTRRRAHGNGFMLIGDAAQLVDPFSGEGIGNALLSAQMAARYAVEGLAKGDFSAEHFSHYEDTVWECIGPELKNSTTMQGMIRKKWLLNWFVKKAAKRKALRDALTEMLADKEAQQKLRRPGFLIRNLLF